MIGSFSEEAQAVWDFVRCQRADGTFYGTGGTCRKGDQTGAKEKEKKERAAAEAPKEDKGYKPKEREERKGLKGLKDRLLGGGKGLDKLVPTEKQVNQAKDGYKQILLGQMEGADKKRAENLQGLINKAEANAKIEISRIGTNQKFANDLKANLPPKVKASVDEDNGEIVLKQKVGKNTIETTFNQKEGFNYRVNGKFDAGTVKDRKEQLQVAMAVRSQYDALVRSLPEGTVIKTSPYNGDGGGAARQKAYEKIGFGKPGDKQEMFAMKKGGRMVPATKSQHDESFKNPDTVWFAEEMKENKKEELKAWFQIVTGEDLLKG